MDLRTKKFKAKLSGDNRKRLYDAQKKSMVRQEKEHTINLVQIENQIKAMAQGEPLLHLPYYIIFGKEIYSKQKKFKAQTLINEVIILEQKWESRGLNPDVLEKIKEFYVQAYKPPAPPVVYFRLDISLLDGPDVLE